MKINFLLNIIKVNFVIFYEKILYYQDEITESIKAKIQPGKGE